MIFTNLPELAIAIARHKQFQNQIKAKRIKKELRTLNDYRPAHLTFTKYEITEAGISFHLECTHNKQSYSFELLLDFDYPFTRPNLLLQDATNPYAWCQDLLDNVLVGSWGPSITITSMLERLPLLCKDLQAHSEHIQATYHINQNYNQQILTKYGVETFAVQEYEWRFNIFRSSINKLLGLTKQYLLKFVKQGSSLRLEMCIRIQDLKQVNATTKNDTSELQIICNSDTNNQKYVLFGKAADLQRIYHYINPIQFIEVKLTQSNLQQLSQDEVKTVIQQYSDLIAYYCLKDTEKTQKYLGIVQELAGRNYGGDQRGKVQKNQIVDNPANAEN